MGGGYKNPHGHRQGAREMSTSVHERGEGVKNRQNIVHVVIEWPPFKVKLHFNNYCLEGSKYIVLKSSFT